MSNDIDKFPCSNCGADLTFEPGTESLTCPYCDTENVIETSVDNAAIKEKDFNKAIQQLKEQESTGETVDMIVTKCTTCAAEVVLEENQTSGECAFCGSVIVAQGESKKILKPESLLPFKINKNQATQHFKLWLKKRWFAPNKLKDYARIDSLKGIYTPFWTFDANTETYYRGQRGDYYYTTESYTTTENGKSVRKTRQVRHTRWSNASGYVQNNFDDLLVHASDRMQEKYVEQLAPWDLNHLEVFNSAFVAGFQVESYSLGLENGFGVAKKKMAPVIDSKIRRDIGGDEQRITSEQTAYNDVTFKHILLPVWMSAYNFKGKIYQFMVNARTGEVQGTRPFSILKIMSAIILCAGAIAGTIYLYNIHS
jgi:DNA-directed RNA polymerase subunit RPC12/RpoP